MEHKPLRDVSHVADVVPETPKLPLTRRERLERWIEVLGREPGRSLNTLREIEHKPGMPVVRPGSTTLHLPWLTTIQCFAPTGSLAIGSGMQSTISSSRKRRLIGSSARACTGRA